MIHKLSNKKGNFTLNGAFILLAVVALIVIIISVVGVLLQINKLNSINSELARYIELRGVIDTTISTELDRLTGIAGLEGVTFDIDADYFGSSQRIQFGEAFTVKLSCTRSIGLGGVVSMPIPLQSSISGRSEKFWK